jgi:hypothetical protein
MPYFFVWSIPLKGQSTQKTSEFCLIRFVLKKMGPVSIFYLVVAMGPRSQMNIWDLARPLFKIGTWLKNIGPKIYLLPKKNCISHQNQAWLFILAVVHDGKFYPGYSEKKGQLCP